VFPLHPQVLGVSFEYPCVNPALDESAVLLAAFHPVALPSAVVNVPRCKTFPYGDQHGLRSATRSSAGLASFSMLDLSRVSCQPEVSGTGTELGLWSDVDQALLFFMTASSIGPAAATDSLTQRQSFLPNPIAPPNSLLPAAAENRPRFMPVPNADESVPLDPLYTVESISNVPPPASLSSMPMIASIVSSDLLMQSPESFKLTAGNDVP